jgi:Flp pilus assembly pilin Flp
MTRAAWLVIATTGATTGRALQRLRADCRGAMAVEFGLIAPVVMLMMLGVVEASVAISTNLEVQAAARAGTHAGFTRPPTAGDMTPIIASTKAAMPADWLSGNNAATVAATLACECEVTGAVACGNPCGLGEAKQTYLRVEVTKNHAPLLSTKFFSPSFQLKQMSMVRLN